ncbi:L-rhamnose isomerase/sugar isomerase [Novosphingobium chloroacetimidivorans]|uniref:L-rhamnose isomerase/sugar isomerase n=1 Tax=Novosphingobium chloroacetimidivorans TaxID=1428314 RepID=A0A7W7KBW7_9SPHN|nr:L-rhamnose catabolism isomerase [Novosphingobium chloroacetimidivorans]MBB4859218.1 L-rhamnose isomerase/sugar isomerase [Novosphingobium chloroacetimidivorans]
MTDLPISAELIAESNARELAALEDDYASLGRKLERTGIDIEAIKSRIASFSVAVPSWGAGRGGTRFAKFPIPGEPTSIHEKLEDCAVIQQLSRVTPRVSPHFPWDKVSDYRGLREEAASLGLSFDAVNSNTFQDQANQAHSYATGSLSSTIEATRMQAIEHNIECIEIGRQLGSKELTVWVGDGTNFPGQQDLARSLDRYLEAAAEVYTALPEDWRMLLEHKMFEPAFYSTVISDWGSSILAAQELGPKAKCLVDLGHHAPNVNIEQIVARLHRFGKLGGFHFNDSKYGDDDLDSGSINPHQLFLVFNELIEAELNPREGFNPSYMIDQSHNVTDPIESMLSSAEAITQCFAKALLVDREALHFAQEANDTMMAFQALRRAYNTDVAPIVSQARLEAGGAVDVLRTYRESRYRSRKSQERKAVGLGAGIV